jgi:hypothetical protein
VSVQHGRIFAAWGLNETIGKSAAYAFECGCVGPHIHALPHVDGDHPEIVEPVQLISVIVRDENRIERRDTGIEELLAHVGRCIDEDLCRSSR